MTDMNTLLFGLYPYIAFLVFLVGSIIRYDRDQYTWKASSSQLLRKDGMRRHSNMFHVGIIFILLGHLVGLLTPESVYHHFISSEAKQMVAMGMGGVFGVICLIGLLGLINRRLNDPRVNASSTRMDIAILFILLAQLLLGLISIFFSAQHLNDATTMKQLAAWAQCIVTLDMTGAVAAITHESVGMIYKLHVLLGMTIFLIFPFGRLVHVASVPFKYFTRNYQIVRQKHF